MRAADKLLNSKVFAKTVSIGINRLPIELVNFGGRGVLGFIDVGSGGGPLPVPWHINSWRIRDLLRFEPRATEGQRNRSIISVDAALWSEHGEREFHVSIAKSGSGSSLLKQNVEYVREHFDELKTRGNHSLATSWFERSEVSEVESVTCEMLDDVLQSMNRNYHFIKVDAQGADYQVLRGGESFLRDSCIGIHCELFTLPLYQDMTLLPDVVDYCDSLGFDLAQKFPPHGSFDSQHDCLFLKRGATGPQMDSVRRAYRL